MWSFRLRLFRLSIAFVQFNIRLIFVLHILRLMCICQEFSSVAKNTLKELLMKAVD